MDVKFVGNETQKLYELTRHLRLRIPPIPRNKSNAAQIQGCDEQPNSRIHRKAAVLICIFEGDDGDLRVILTERSSNLSSHSGEVALPGGKMEEGDADEVATALREAEEEIGLDPSLVDVVTLLNPFTMKNGMVVVPVIGLLYDRVAFRPMPNPAEVEAIFDAPLEMFLKNDNRREVEGDWMGQKYALHYFDYKANGRTYVIFALTAGILIETASLVYRQSPAFEERKPNFWHKVSSSSL